MQPQPLQNLVRKKMTVDYVRGLGFRGYEPQAFEYLVSVVGCGVSGFFFFPFLLSSLELSDTNVYEP